jgi:hypothetical protein
MKPAARGVAPYYLAEIRHDLSQTTLILTLEIEGSAADGYPDDIIDVVRSNIRDLKLDINTVGFEEE